MERSRIAVCAGTISGSLLSPPDPLGDGLRESVIMVSFSMSRSFVLDADDSCSMGGVGSCASGDTD